MPRLKPDFELPWSDGHHWGIECEQGWFAIIKELDADLKVIFPEYRVLQVKEKFGGLRYYTGGVPDDVDKAFHARIRLAEQEAALTCEWCGSRGQLQPGSWMRTLCDDCQGKAARRQMPWMQ